MSDAAQSREESRLAPGFLVSVPQMADPNFERSVIYLIAHGEEGAFGLTLNRPGSLVLPEVCAEFGFTPDTDDPVFSGGPVELNRGFLLHGGGQPLPGADTIETGIHLSGMPETLRLACEQQTPFRLYLGYAGWGPGQLDDELSQGTWLSIVSQPHYIFESTPERMWQKILSDSGFDPATIAMSGGAVN